MSHLIHTFGILDEIIQFWQSQYGDKLIGYQMGGVYDCVYHISDDVYYESMAPPMYEDLLFCVPHRINERGYRLINSWHTETEMLRLIKLKAFL